jgi:raffinose/stachyose/melibiose transport system permease protein
MIQRSKLKQYPTWFLIPALLVFGTLFVTPTLLSFFFSFTDWNVNKRVISFIGLENFRELFADVKLRATISNTIIYSFSVTLLRNLLGLFLALLLNMSIRGKNILRTIFFLPFVIAPIVIGYLFKAVYQPQYGLLNTLFRGVGLSFLANDWLNDPSIALFSTIMVDVWRTTGFTMVIYLAGLQLIPKELYESAEIDGANGIWRFLHVTFPLLAASVTVNVVLSLIGTMKVFVMIMVLTNGGPGFATEVLNTYINNYAFSFGLYGYGTAANMILSVLILVLGVPVLVFLRKREVEL